MLPFGLGWNLAALGGRGIIEIIPGGKQSRGIAVRYSLVQAAGRARKQGNMEKGRTVMSTVFRLAGAVSIALLVACGGGSVAPVSPPEKIVTSFPLQAGYQKRISGGFTTYYNVSEGCNGSAIKKQDLPTHSVTFEGSPAAQSAQGSTLLFLPDCPPSPSASVFVNYYNADGSLLGHSLVTPNPSPAPATPLEYGVFTIAESSLPVSVKVGDGDSLGTEKIYSDSTKTTVTGYDFLSYMIETDAPSKSTAIVNLITKRYDALTNGNLIFTQQARSRIVEDGTLTDMSIDVVEGSSHLLYAAITR